MSFEQLIGDIIAKKSLFVLITGDFNVRSTNWWKNDLSTSEGTQVDSLTTSYGLSQIISDPTHILPNSSSCIDLIFTNQPNLVTKSGVHPSLHPKISPSNCICETQSQSRVSSFVRAFNLGLQKCRYFIN